MKITLEIPPNLAADLKLLCERSASSPERELILALAEKTARLEHAQWLLDTAKKSEMPGPED